MQCVTFTVRRSIVQKVAERKCSSLTNAAIGFSCVTEVRRSWFSTLVHRKIAGKECSKNAVTERGSVFNKVLRKLRASIVAWLPDGGNDYRSRFHHHNSAKHSFAEFR